MTDEFEWSQDSQKSDGLDESQTLTGQGHLDDGHHDDDEVQLVPTVLQVGVVVHEEPETHDLQQKLDDENAVDHVVHVAQVLFKPFTW